MKNDLSESLRTLIIDIKDEVNYDNDKLLIELGNQVTEKKNPGKSGIFKKFNFSRVFCQSLYEYFDQYPLLAAGLRSYSSRFSELLNNHGLTFRSIQYLSDTGLFFARLRLILCFPVYLIGVLLHLLPLAVIHFRLKAVRDQQFMSSVKFVLGLILVPLNYLILFLVLLSFYPPVISVALMATVPLSGFLAYSCFRYSVKQKEIIFYNEKCRQDKKLDQTLGDLRLNIIEKLQPVFIKAEEKLK
jgi:hypothetical protein